MNEHKFCSEHAAVKQKAGLSCGAIEKLQLAMNTKVSTKNMLVISGIIAGILMAIFGILYDQNRTIGTDVTLMKVNQVKIISDFTNFVKHAPPPHKHDSEGHLIK